MGTFHTHTTLKSRGVWHVAPCFAGKKLRGEGKYDTLSESLIVYRVESVWNATQNINSIVHPVVKRGTLSEYRLGHEKGARLRVNPASLMKEYCTVGNHGLIVL
jgi:hypothetical protein